MIWGAAPHCSKSHCFFTSRPAPGCLQTTAATSEELEVMASDTTDFIEELTHEESLPGDKRKVAVMPKSALSRAQVRLVGCG